MISTVRVDSSGTHSDNIVVPMNSYHGLLSAKSIKSWLISITMITAVLFVCVTVVYLLSISKNPISILNLESLNNTDHNFDSLKRPIRSADIQEILGYDFIIIGGGTAGCLLSSRLAEYGFKILLLASGSNDTLNPMMTEKSLFNQLFRFPHFRHFLPTNPSPNLNNRTLDLTVWNTLGGNSINGGGIQRLMSHDWNYFINATDDQSFHVRMMSRYYKMVENFTSTDPSTNLTIHGNRGPIKITQSYDSIFNQIWKNVAKELNETYTNDLANTIDYGFSFEPSSFTNGKRNWSCDNYLTSTLNKYSNLKVLTETTAIKFNINKKTKQVKNVLFISKDGLFLGIARKEYILSAGTFFSPHILMLSGIGDPKILQENHISIQHSLKQVGKNLLDNGILIMKFQTQNFSLGQSIPVALINNSNIFFILKIDENTNYLYVLIFNSSPKSKNGFISLYNSNPLTPPKIDLDYLTDSKDLETFIHAIHYIRKVMSTETMRKFANITEILPGLECNDLNAYIKNNLDVSQHFVGTCSIGRSAEDSVINNHFQVHGINNLRVVDASIFPANFATKSGPFLTVHALAEKAAHIIRQTYS